MEKEVVKKPTVKMVVADTFNLQFGYDYPIVPIDALKYIKTYKDPKTNGSNGKNSRFR